MRRVHQKSLSHDDDVEMEEIVCSSSRCQYTTHFRWEQKKHLARCPFVMMDEEISKHVRQHEQQMEEKEKEFKETLLYQQTCFRDEMTAKDSYYREELAEKEKTLQQEIVKRDMEIQRLLGRLEAERLNGRLEVMESRLEKSDELVSQALHRPTTTNNNNVNSNNHNVQYILADGKTFAEYTDPKRVEAIARENLEPYYLQGQAGVAKFLFNHIIKQGDDDIPKLLLACTDNSRKKFRYTNEKNEVEEDIGASKFIDKVAPPIRTVSNELHSTITKQLRDDMQSHRIDAIIADKKEERADKALMEISLIDNSEKNHDLTRHLCNLTKV